MTPAPTTHAGDGGLVPGLASTELEALLTERARLEVSAGRFDQAMETLRVARMLFPEAPGPLRAAAGLEERRGQRLRAEIFRRIAGRLERRGSRP